MQKAIAKALRGTARALRKAANRLDPPCLTPIFGASESASRDYHEHAMPTGNLVDRSIPDDWMMNPPVNGYGLRTIGDENDA